MNEFILYIYIYTYFYVYLDLYYKISASGPACYEGVHIL